MPVPRTLRSAPLTVSLVWAACAVFIGVQFQTRQRGISEGEARRQWGAMVSLSIVNKSRPDAPVVIEKLNGPFDVWDADKAQWWRYLVNNLHHGDLMHLLFNGWALLYLGRILEPRMGAMRTLLFLTGAGAVSLLPDSLLGATPIGLSGIAYAMVGLLMVWRDRDPDVARECPMLLIVLAGIWLWVGQILTYTGSMRIANQAHFAGLIYGWVWGQAYLGERESKLFRFLFGVAHLALIPAIWFLMNPFWNGAWHWYQARDAEFNSRRRLERLQVAVLRDPALGGAWRELSIEFLRHNEPLTSFRAALQGLKANRLDADLHNLVVAHWVDLHAIGEDKVAHDLFVEIFRDDSLTWETTIASAGRTIINRRAWTAETLAEFFDSRSDPRVLGAVLNDVPATQPPRAPNVDPQAPDSARHGELM